MSFRFTMNPLLFLVVTAGFVCSEAAATKSSNGSSTAIADSATMPLNESKVRQAYEDGDFETTVALIESFLRTHPVYSKNDSIFIAKHLAVIYAANPATREKGKNYMFRLLDLMPSASIIDMFVSDEIDRIFEKIREEYIVRQKRLGRPTPTQVESNRFAIDQMTKAQLSSQDSDNAASPKPPPATGKTKAGISPKVYWIAGSAALVAATGTLVYVLASDRQANTSGDKNYVIPQ